MEDVATRHAAVLFADVAGSTRLYETAGDAAAQQMIGRCLEVMGAVCREHDGRVVKTIGDEVMALFPGAGNAGYAAIEVHKRIAALNESNGSSLAIHAGFHVGPVLEDQSDAFGDTVNVAARLCSLAKRDQTLMAAQTLQQLPAPLRVRTRSQDVQAVRGKSADIELFELLWQDSEEELTTLAPRRSGRQARLTLRSREREVALEDANVLTFGRDGNNDFVILDRKASRLHARIERRRDKFVLIDHSTNGTFCTPQGEPEVELRREELLLRGRGRIYFGHPSVEDPNADAIDFDTNAG
ncbi:MAG TPA: adenylate/guanylate cyclase domain-containing protein [Casimicrobiaceae bacterium]|nr:adenylate/guanylate cyclase domain-containing protein [Casimicrobiaceae bacterium]